MDVFIQFSEGDPGSPVYVNDPTILGQTKPIEVLPLPEHSALIYIYQDPATNETAFHPVQADQHCHRYGILNEANLRFLSHFENIQTTHSILINHFLLLPLEMDMVL